METVLLEREAELRAVEAALVDAEHRQVSIVFVSGEPGIGKTVLLGEARRLAGEHGFQVRTTAFTPLSEAGSCALLWDWFPDAVAKDLGSASAEPFDGPAALIPSAILGNALGEPAALAYAAQWAISGLAAAKPQLLVVDDLHWADEASVRLLASLTLRLRNERVAIVIASRPMPNDDGIVATLLAAPATRSLSPGPLSLSGVTRLVERVAAGLPAAAREERELDPEQVLKVSGGVPFYVCELLASDAEATPDRVVQSLRARLAALPAESRRVAEILAIAGGALPFAVLGSAAQLQPAALHECLTELETAAIAAVGDTEASILHPIVAEAIVSGTGGDRRARTHERIAAALSEAGMPISVRAAHELHVPPSGDPARARLLRTAAELAETAGSPTTAARFYARASREGGLPEAERIELVFAEGRSRTTAGDGRSGLELIAGVIQEVSDPLARGDRWAQLGDLAYMAGNLEVSTTAYERARAALREGATETPEGRLILAKILANEVTYRPGAASTVIALAEEAASRAQPGTPIDAADAAFHAVASLARVLAEGVSPGAREAASRAFSAGLAPGGSDDPITYMLSGALNYLAMFDEAEELLGAALDDARERGSVFGFATASYARGALRFRFGRIRAGLADLEASWSSIGLGWHTYFYAIRHYLVLALIRTGEFERAAEVAATSHQGPDPAFPVIGRMTQLVVQLSQGDLDAALSHAEALATEPNPLAQAGVEWRTLLAEAYTRRGAPGDAERSRLLIRESLEQLGPATLPLHRAAILLEAARLAGNDEREILFSQVVTLCDDESVYEANAARLELARIEADRGHVGAARRGARAALDYAVSEGLRPLANAAYELLSRIDPARTLAGPEQRLTLLSPSELRVAAAAASGRSNREIARQQFVTMRTVEFHLTNVYRKLAISSRDELRRVLAPMNAEV